MKSRLGTLSLLAIFCLLVRLLPFRAPNVEPILASAMPLASVYGALAGTLFAATSILLYDIVTGTLGVHTLFTLFAYGALGMGAGYYFQKRRASISSYVGFAIAGTLFYDAVTGLIPGPVFFDQPFLVALSGQIPFTALHLLGNVVFAMTLSPAIGYLLKRKRKRQEASSIITTLNPNVT